MVKVENLKMGFEDHEIFRNLSLTINDKETVGIIGPSGTGKSVLLKCIMMLTKPSSGRIFLDGDELTTEGAVSSDLRKRIGMVFQYFNLFEHLTVVENVMSGLTDLQGADAQTAYEEAMKLLRHVGLADKAFAFPSKLSGGQQQRAAIARTLAMKPEVILLDEPTSALDPMARGEVETVIRMMAEAGHTMVIASNEMELIRQTCSRVIFLHDGGVYEEGTPEKIFDNPERTQTRRFVQALRVLELNVNSSDFDFIGLQTTLTEYAYRNGVPSQLLYRLQSVLEELFAMVIIQPKEENRMHISLEYSNAAKNLSGVVRCSGRKIDPDDPFAFLSWPIIKKRVSEITLEDIDDGEYTNLIRFIME